MDLVRRFALFFVGVVIGLIVLMYWNNTKKQELGHDIFPYGPNARTLRSLEKRPHRAYSEESKSFMKAQSIDTADISKILKYGEINFAKSHPRKEPCADYWLDINLRKVDYSLVVTRCDSTITFNSIAFKK
ncbi:MAG: DUF4258 domain-containing protein [Flavobacteriaceae bacterium]